MANYERGSEFQTPCRSVRNLCRLPREIMDQILPDLQIYQLLYLASYNVPYLNKTIVELPHFRDVFPKDEDFSQALRLYQLNRIIPHSGKRRAEGLIDMYIIDLRLNLSQFARRAKSRLQDYWAGNLDAKRRIRTYWAGKWNPKGLLQHQIEEKIGWAENQIFRLSLFIEKQNDFRQFTRSKTWTLEGSSFPERYSQCCTNFVKGANISEKDVLAMEDVWRTLESAQNQLNEMQSKQIMRYAALFAEFPGMLKPLNDPDQSAVRNEEHIIKRLQRDARKILLATFVGKKNPAKHLFPRALPAFVPYDYDLELFLKISRRFPPAPEKTQNGSMSETRLFPEIYTPEVIEDVKKVVEGLQSYYFLTGKAIEQRIGRGVRFPRTRNTPYSQIPYNTTNSFGPPRFVTEPEYHPFSTQHLADERGLWPIAEEEFEWLEAFLRVCTFMKGMTEVSWEESTSVADLWKDRRTQKPRSVVVQERNSQKTWKLERKRAERALERKNKKQK